MKQLSIYYDKLILNQSKIKFDTIGAFASGLCMLHCIATPFFFIASACSSSCCSTAPSWWQWIDYGFLGISFFSIYQATKSTTKEWVTQGLWVSWIALFILIMNVRFEWFLLAENIKFIPAFTLVGLHLYNMRYCQCENKECC